MHISTLFEARRFLHGDPTNASPAEVAFLTAIAIARRQDARSYELISSLSLARLYQSTGRAEQALSLLTPALKGFSPTLEMPHRRGADARRSMSPRCALGQLTEAPLLRAVAKSANGAASFWRCRAA